MRRLAEWGRRVGVQPILFVLILVLLIALLFEGGFVTPGLLTTNKELIAVAETLVTLFLVIVAAVLSYYKFFRGRTIAPQLTIKLGTGVAKAGNGLMHWLDVELANTGPVAIWEPVVLVTAFLHGDDLREEPVSRFVPAPDAASHRTRVVDPGQSEHYHCFHTVATTFAAVTFRVEVTDRANHLWWRSVTVANAPPKALG